MRQQKTICLTTKPNTCALHCWPSNVLKQYIQFYFVCMLWSHSGPECIVKLRLMSGAPISSYICIMLSIHSLWLSSNELLAPVLILPVLPFPWSNLGTIMILLTEDIETFTIRPIDDFVAFEHPLLSWTTVEWLHFDLLTGSWWIQ